MPIKKMSNHVVELNKVFILRKEKIYPLSREERGDVHEFIEEYQRKEYIRLSKLPQTAPVFSEEKKDRKKHIIYNYRYLNEWTIKNDGSIIIYK